jgi:hypothetical protein
MNSSASSSSSGMEMAVAGAGKKVITIKKMAVIALMRFIKTGYLISG